MKNMPWPENSPKIDMRNFTASIKKAHTCLGWSPKVSFEEGIKTTVEWYLKNQEWWKDITDIKTLNSIQWKS